MHWTKKNCDSEMDPRINDFVTVSHLPRCSGGRQSGYFINESQTSHPSMQPAPLAVVWHGGKPYSWCGQICGCGWMSSVPRGNWISILYFAVWLFFLDRILGFTNQHPCFWVEALINSIIEVLNIWNLPRLQFCQQRLWESFGMVAGWCWKRS